VYGRAWLQCHVTFWHLRFFIVLVNDLTCMGVAAEPEETSTVEPPEETTPGVKLVVIVSLVVIVID